MNRRNNARLFAEPKRADEVLMQREDRHSMEHLTEIQRELQELRDLVIENKAPETTQHANFGEEHEMKFKMVFGENERLVNVR